MVNTALASRLLRSARPAPVPAILQRAAGKAGPIQLSRSGRRIADAGMYGGPATLPANPSSPDPDPGALPGANLPSDMFVDNSPVVEFPRGGGISEGGRLTVDAGQGSMNPGSFGPINSGEHWLGGTFDSTDPVTGQPVYNPLGYGRMGDLSAPYSSFGPYASATNAAADWERSYGYGSAVGGGGSVLTKKKH